PRHSAKTAPTPPPSPVPCPHSSISTPACSPARSFFFPAGSNWSGSNDADGELLALKTWKLPRACQRVGRRTTVPAIDPAAPQLGAAQSNARIRAATCHVVADGGCFAVVAGDGSHGGPYAHPPRMLAEHACKRDL